MHTCMVTHIPVKMQNASTTPKVPFCPSLATCYSLHSYRPWDTTVLISISIPQLSLFLSFIHMDAITPYLPFDVCLLPFSMFFSAIGVIVCIGLLQSEQYSTVLLYCTFKIHSPCDGHFFFPSVLATINKAAVNMLNIPFYFSWATARSKIAGYNIVIFLVLEDTAREFSKLVVPFHILLAMESSSCFASHLSNFHIVSLLHFHSYWC